MTLVLKQFPKKVFIVKSLSGEDTFNKNYFKKRRKCNRRSSVTNYLETSNDSVICEEKKLRNNWRSFFALFTNNDKSQLALSIPNCGKYGVS